jgi:putative intracellular protease/amidase
MVLSRVAGYQDAKRVAFAGVDAVSEDTTLSDGTLLVAGRNLTGFAWSEEVLARVNKLVPYNAEEEVKKRCARYEKGLIPFASHVVVDGRLVTGQNPGSAKATANKVVSVLEG